MLVACDDDHTVDIVKGKPNRAKASEAEINGPAKIVSQSVATPLKEGARGMILNHHLNKEDDKPSGPL